MGPCIQEWSLTLVGWKVHEYTNLEVWFVLVAQFVDETNGLEVIDVAGLALFTSNPIIL